MDMTAATPGRELTALAYHDELVSYLQAREAAIWDWSRSDDVRDAQSAEIRDIMLRQTYRMEADSHPEAHAACRRAMERLGIDAPATLYQAQDGQMNASLCFIPGEVHLVFFGIILEKLNEEELLALLGHELSHYKLWMANEGAHHNASRIIDHSLSYPDAAPSHRETARLLSLYTELYADRGAASVCDAPGPAISVLVKTMTGMGYVDPAAYLRQAEELDASFGQSEGVTHPEVFLRARALDKWWTQDPGADAWIEDKLRGKLSLQSLDLLRQRDLTGLTRAFLGDFIRSLPLQSDAVTAQAHRYFPDFGDQEDSFDAHAIGEDRIDDSTRDYLIALMLDCALADPDARDAVLREAAKTARTMGAGVQLGAALRRDLKWTKAAADRLLADAAKAA